MAKAPVKGSDTAKKDGGMKTLLVAGAILTLVAAGGGWFLGAQIGKEIAPPPVTAEKNEDAAKTADMISSNTNVTVLTPILTNMAAPNTAWIRMEIALVAQPGEIISPAMAAEISNDFLAFLRDSTIAQIKGPSGLMNLREDLLDRARIRSDGKVTNVLISSLVVEQ
ncbi:flagellar basal body-associated FliL family protein [Bartonella sp. LJL80]